MALVLEGGGNNNPTDLYVVHDGAEDEGAHQPRTKQDTQLAETVPQHQQH